MLKAVVNLNKQKCMHDMFVKEKKNKGSLEHWSRALMALG